MIGVCVSTNLMYCMASIPHFLRIMSSFNVKMLITQEQIPRSTSENSPLTIEFVSFSRSLTNPPEMVKHWNQDIPFYEVRTFKCCIVLLLLPILVCLSLRVKYLGPAWLIVILPDQSQSSIVTSSPPEYGEQQEQDNKPNLEWNGNIFSQTLLLEIIIINI